MLNGVSICEVFVVLYLFVFFFFNDTPTTEIYTYLHTLSLHDALPISPAPFRTRRYAAPAAPARSSTAPRDSPARDRARRRSPSDRKSTRLNSVTNAHLVCRLLLEKKQKQTYAVSTLNESTPIWKSHTHTQITTYTIPT